MTAPTTTGKALAAAWLGLCALILGAAPLVAAVPGGADITRVELLNDTGGGTLGYPDLSGAKLDSKFTGRDVLSGRETFDVYWTPPSGGLPAGASLLLEYRRRFNDAVRGLSRQFAFSVAGERKTTFLIEDEDVREAGPIAMWRVRLVHKGRLLAESASENWR